MSEYLRPGSVNFSQQFLSQTTKEPQLTHNPSTNRRRFVRNGLLTIVGLTTLPAFLEACGGQAPTDIIHDLYPALDQRTKYQDLHLKTSVPVRIANYARNVHVDPDQATRLYKYLSTLQPRQVHLGSFYNDKYLDQQVYIQQRTGIKQITAVIISPDIPRPTWEDQPADGVTDVSPDGTYTFTVIRTSPSQVPLSPLSDSLTNNVLWAFATEASQENIMAGDKPKSATLVDTEWWNNSLGFALAFRGENATFGDYDNLWFKGLFRIPVQGGRSYYEFDEKEYNAMPANLQVFSEVKHH